jgi:hypothetical protein
VDKQRNYSQSHGEIIGYDVDVVDGQLRETPIYELHPAPTPAQPSTEYEAPLTQMAKIERVANRTRTFRGKSLASASIFFASVAGVMYAGDAVSTFAQEQRLISPLDAYEDFTELPSLIGPAIDKAQAVIEVFNG